jgi:murein DD-endopeptidase MepM/ murein hydrolase activator NlpD
LASDLSLSWCLAMLAKGVTAASGAARDGRSQPQSITDELRTILPEDKNIRISSDFGLRKDPISGDQAGYGNVVIIDHGDGFVSKYAHNKANLVSIGDPVSPATVIATVGSTGRSTGPHVHFEVSYQGEKVHPRVLLAQAEERGKG